MPMPATCGGRAADGDRQGERGALRKNSHRAGYGNVQKQGNRTDGKPPKMIEDQGKAGDPAGGKIRAGGKGIDPDGIKNAAHKVAAQVQRKVPGTAFFENTIQNM